MNTFKQEEILKNAIAPQKDFLKRFSILFFFIISGAFTYHYSTHSSQYKSFSVVLILFASLYFVGMLEIYLITLWKKKRQKKYIKNASELLKDKANHTEVKVEKISAWQYYLFFPEPNRFAYGRDKKKYNVIYSEMPRQEFDGIMIEMPALGRKQTFHIVIPKEHISLFCDK